MPFFYADAEGFVAIGPTLPQWRLVAPELTGEVGRAFVETGQTDRPLALADELQPDGQPEPMATLLRQLRDAAEKAASVLMLDDGTTPEAAP